MRTTEEENMDYVYNYNDMQFFIETKNNIEEKMHRRLIFMRILLENSAKKRQKVV